jgi:hypothetical protein
MVRRRSLVAVEDWSKRIGAPMIADARSMIVGDRMRA